jgi:hypothetical protein
LQKLLAGEFASKKSRGKMKPRNRKKYRDKCRERYVKSGRKAGKQVQARQS